MRLLLVAVLLLLPGASLCGARRLTQQFSSCAQARNYCYGSLCKPEGVDSFECDEAGFFSSGGYSCQCNPSSLASVATKCFSSSSVVTTPSGPRRMSELKAGDSVLSVGPTGALQFDQVFMFSSRRPDEVATFVRIRTDTGANLTVTPGHYLFAWPAADVALATAALKSSPTSWPYVLPSKVSRGDLMPVAAGTGVRLARIVSIERTVDVGVFMPHSWSGAIIVDGVAATELTCIVPPSLAGHRFHSAFSAVMRAAFKLLPANVVEAAVRATSAWAHGTADATTMPGAAALGNLAGGGLSA